MWSHWQILRSIFNTWKRSSPMLQGFTKILSSFPRWLLRLWSSSGFWAALTHWEVLFCHIYLEPLTSGLHTAVYWDNAPQREGRDLQTHLLLCCDGHSNDLPWNCSGFGGDRAWHPAGRGPFHVVPGPTKAFSGQGPGSHCSGAPLPLVLWSLAFCMGICLPCLVEGRPGRKGEQ